jgi:flagellar biosynthesis protein FliR
VPILTFPQIESWLGSAFWPFLRIGACLMVAPVFGTSYAPPRIRIVLAGALTLVALPLLPPVEGLTLLSADGIVTTIEQVIVGAALGFALQLMFDALTLGGQIIANGMGLGFAFNVDPLRGVTTPALGQFYSLLGVLVFLSLDGHLALIDTLITSFKGLPVSPHGLSLAATQSLADWGDELFMGALRVALPGMTALMVINLAFGVMARAAPALNLFAVGFPITLVFGFVIVLFGLPGIQMVVVDLVTAAFTFMRTIVGSS